MEKFLADPTQLNLLNTIIPSILDFVEKGQLKKAISAAKKI